MLRTRLLTAAVALPPLLALIFLGPAWSIELFVAWCCAWGLYEVAAMAAGGSPALIVLAVVAGAIPAAIGLLGWAPGISALLGLAAIAAMCAILGWVDWRAPATHLPRILLVIIGGLYVGALYPYFALLRDQAGGVKLLVALLLVVMAGDSGAYFAGRAVGRIKLLPAVSPGKTVEGAIAYVISGMAAAVILDAAMGTGWGARTAVGFGALISIVAQAGDLAESALKRVAGVKDSGWLFPGHGGLLDRADSLVFAAFFAYYYSRWLGLPAA